MKCKRAQKLLSRFMDDELPETQASSVEEHLMHCSECRAELEMQRRLWATIGSVEPISAPDVIATLEERLSERPKGGSFLDGLRLRSFGYAMAAAALIGLFVWTGIWAGRAPQASPKIEQDRSFDELLTDTPPGLEILAMLDQIGEQP